MNLMENYKGRLALAEKYYAQKSGSKMDADRKLVTAACLDNTAKFINEAFNSSVGTQRSDLGKFKLFCLDITTLTVPNLVVNDLFLVKPMASFTGYLTYLQFAYSVDKGGIEAGEVFMNESPFTYRKMDENRANYTSDRVVEAATAGAAFAPIWGPVDPKVKPFDSGAVDSEGNKIYKNVKIVCTDTPTSGDPTTKVTYADYTTDSEGKYIIAASNLPATSEGHTYSNYKVAYIYDNIVIPQAQLPSIKAEMKGITLEARARRIAVTYSQIAAFQAKQDYGIDFEATINKQAQAELQYQIDGEAIYMIQNAWDEAEGARAADAKELVTWIDANPDTISYSMRAEGFARAIEDAKMKVFVRTQKLTPTWMLVSPDIMPVLTFVPGFKGNSNAIAAGAYIAGDINGLKVICSPAVAYGSAYLGVLGSDGITATGVFAPYMPLVPTQLLGFADGTMTQGFSTLYDMKILNNLLVQKIAVNHVGMPAPLDVNVVNADEIGA